MFAKGWSHACSPEFYRRGYCLNLIVGFAWNSNAISSPQSASSSPLELFPSAATDPGIPEISAAVIETSTGKQVILDVGYDDGVEVGQLLNVQRGGAAHGMVEVIEVFSHRCRCLADEELAVGDRARLGISLQIGAECTTRTGIGIEHVSIGVFRLSNNYIDAPTLVASGLTDASGKIALPAIDAVQHGSYGTDLLIVAKKDGFASIVTPMRDLTSEFNFKLSDEAATLVGIVFSPDGKPLQDALVGLPGRYSHIPDVQSTKTDGKGKFRIDDLATWSPAEGHARPLWIAHPDFSQTTIMFSKIPAVLIARLVTAAVIEGTVIDGVTSTPLPGALVSAQGISNHGWYQVRSDKNGKYQLRMSADRYNVWAEQPERIPIAIDSIEAVPGLTKSKNDIAMVTGGLVYGKHLDAEGKPLENGGRARIAHYGPARPRSGAAVTSTVTAADGTYRLRVAPGANYVYTMSGNCSANIAITDGQELELNLLTGTHQGGELNRAVPMLKLRAAENIEKAEKFRPSRQRGNAKVGLLLDQLEQQNSGKERFNDPWLFTLQQLADLGAEAVPELCKELDETDSDIMMRCMGLVLRAIDDKRAVPALIRAIPKTLLRPGSDMGVRVEDKGLEKFAHTHDLDESNEAGMYSFGRPVREIMRTLQKLTGHQLDDDQLFHIFLNGNEQQIAMRQKLFERHAIKWATWWEANAPELGVPVDYQKVNLPQIEEVVTVAAMQLDVPYKVTGGGSNWILESALNPKSNTVFYDFDTGRVSKLPEQWRDTLPSRDATDSELAKLPQDEIDKWAIEEGFDMMGTELPAADGEERVYALRLIGAQAWQVKDERWKTQPGRITLQELIDEGREAHEFLFHEGPNLIDRQKPASFLIITGDGTPALVFLGIQVLDDSLKPGGVANGDNELNPIAFRKGRRFAFNFFEAIVLPDR